MTNYSLHILHLEDEMTLCEIVHATLLILEPQCKLIQFQKSDDAVRYGLEHITELDLLLFDVRVPGSTDGIGAARLLRTLGYTRLLAFTSAFQPPEPSIVRELDCNWLPKPIGLAQMQMTLQAARRPSTSLLLSG
jgi:DNA-binding response OmpR family regulator